MAIYYDIKINYKKQKQMARLYADKIELREENDLPVILLDDAQVKYRFPFSFEVFFKPLDKTQKNKDRQGWNNKKSNEEDNAEDKQKRKTKNIFFPKAIESKDIKKELSQKIVLPLNRFTLKIFFPDFYANTTSFLIIALSSFLFPLVLFWKTSVTFAFLSAFFSVVLNLFLALFFMQQSKNVEEESEKKILYPFFVVSLFAAFLYFRFPHSYVFILGLYFFIAIFVFLSFFVKPKELWHKLMLIFSWLFTVIASFYLLIVFLFTSFDVIQILRYPLAEFVVQQEKENFSLLGKANTDELIWQVQAPFSAKKYSKWIYPLRANFSSFISSQLIINSPKLTLSYFDHEDIGYAGIFPASAKETFALIKNKLEQKQYLFWSIPLEDKPVLLELDTQEINPSLQGKTLLQKISMKHLISKKEFSLVLIFFQKDNSLYTRFWLFDLPQDSSIDLLLTSVLKNLTPKK